MSRKGPDFPPQELVSQADELLQIHGHPRLDRNGRPFTSVVRVQFKQELGGTGWELREVIGPGVDNGKKRIIETTPTPGGQTERVLYEFGHPSHERDRFRRLQAAGILKAMEHVISIAPPFVEPPPFTRHRRKR